MPIRNLVSAAFEYLFQAFHRIVIHYLGIYEAERAGEIATERPEGEARGAGEEMEERLLLYRVDPDRCRPVHDSQDQFPFHVGPHAAEPRAPFRYRAVAVACEAPDRSTF